MKNRTRRCLSLILAALMIVTTVFGNLSLTAVAEDGATAKTIAEWSWSSKPDPIYPMNATRGDGTINISEGLTAASNANGTGASGWSEGKAFLISFDATDYKNLTFTASLKSSKTGPATFALQYFDGTDWQNIGESVSLPSDSKNQLFNEVSLGDLGKSAVSLRIVCIDPNAVNGSTIANGGTCVINNVSINGIYDGETPLKPQCAPVQVNEKPAYEVLIGDTVSLTCATEGASIYYSFSENTGFSLYESPIEISEATTIYAFSSLEGYDNSEIAQLKVNITKCKTPYSPTKSQSEVEVGQKITLLCSTQGATIYYKLKSETEWKVYTEELVIPDVDEDTYSINIKASCDKYADSGSTTLNYYIKRSTPVVPPITDDKTSIKELTDGAEFYVFAKKDKVVLSYEATGKKLKGVSASVSENDILSIELEEGQTSESLNLAKLKAVKNEDGTYKFTLTSGETVKYLTCPATGNGISFTESVDDEYINWKVEKLENGAFLFGNTKASYTNTKNGVVYDEYVEYFNGAFTTYNFSNETTTDTSAFELALYPYIEFTQKQVVVPPVVENGTSLSQINDGDKIIIFNNGSKVAVSNKAASGGYPLGVTCDIVNDRLTYTRASEEDQGNKDIAVFTVHKSGEGASAEYTFSVETGEGADKTTKYLGVAATGTNLIFADSSAANNVWLLEGSKDEFLFRNKTAVKDGKPLYLEWYSKYNDFSTYTYNESNKGIYAISLHSTVDVKRTSNCLSSVSGGDLVVIYSNGNVLSETASGSKLKGVVASPDADNYLSAPDGAAYLNVVINEDGTYSFKNAVDGKYLSTTATGNSLSFETEASELAKWELIPDTAGFNIKSKTAEYEGKQQCIEFYSKNFTTYGMSESGPAFLINFYKVKLPALADESKTFTIAQWAGNANYIEANVTEEIFGDSLATNDMLDNSVKYTAVVSGKAVKPFSASTSTTTGSTSYYMGGTGLGSGTDDYLQFELSSKGYANLKMDFRLRASNTAAGDYQLKYSTDGTHFNNFTNGTYAYAYTAYKSDGSSSNVSKEGAITDGVAKASLAPTNYVSFSFNVPREANNAERLYIRLVPGDKQASKDEAPTTEGVLRVDSVTIKANPIVGDSICSYVSATPDSGSVALGEKITLSTLTEGATIKYSVNGGEFNTYDATAGVTFDELPSVLTVYAVKEGLSDSIKTTYTYTQAQCEPVKASPNGGAVRINTELKLKDKTEGSAILYRFSEEDEWKPFEDDLVLSTLPVTIQVKAVKSGYLDSAVSTLSFTEKLNDKFNIYFGQIHSHTTISDGAGSLEEAFNHAKKVDNLDYIVVTDHSNSFDGADSGDITKNTDTKENDEWTYAHNLADSSSTDNFTCLYGYEMTWSNGLGHMNTYNTPGFQSRTQKDYSTYSTALNNYYTALEKVPDSISMFNHPGTTFGDFQDFAYYSEARDALINLIEVGNGEGAIGSSGYFPSYEYYTRALDKGWHVAPTNNQDNHKGLWGDANTARTVVLADVNNEENIYDAMRNRRVYATEDNDLSIYYTLDGHDMGEILEKDAVGETVELKVELSDPTDPVIGKVSVVVNGGLVIDSKNINSNSETVVFNVPSVYSYYYIRIDEGDKDIAVTAPVWVGEVEACGIASVSTDTVLPVAGEEIDINVDFYNNEKLPLELTGMEIDVLDAESVLTHVASLTKSDLEDVASNGTFTKIINHTYNAAGKVTYIVKATALLNGVEKIYEGKLSANYVAPEMVGNIIIDGSHFNDYVTGYYGGNMNNFISMAADANLRAKVVTDKITAETLEDCRLLVISAPAKKNGTANAGEYTISHFDDVFIETVKNYVARGGNLIVCGLADYQDSNGCQSSTELNKLLTAVGSTLRINSDEICDDVKNGGQKFRLYPENFNTESELLAGLVNGQVYSQYSGCSVYAESNEETDFVYAPAKLVTGFDTTYCLNSTGHDSNFVDLGKGNVNFLMSQQTKAGGYILAAGGVFVSDFEVKAELDNNDSLPYANYTIASNLIKASKVQLPVSTIAEARAGETGEVFAVEGYVTSGTDNEFTTFFDTIYIQDDTAGIDIFPYAEAGLAIGTKVRITGFVSSYQGDKELKVIEVEILDAEPYVYEAKELSAKDAMDYEKFGGSLLKTTGVVSKVLIENGALAEFWLNDGSGKEAAIFIDGYIYSGTTGKNNLASKVKVGATVSAEGVLYMHPEGNSDVSVPVFRVRNCDDITIIKEAANSGSETGSGSNTGASSSDGATASTPSAKETVSTPATTAVPGRTTTASIPSTTVDVVEENDTIETVDDTKAEVEEEATTAAPENEEVSIGEDAAPTAGLSDTEKTGLGLWLVLGGGVAAVCVAGYGVFHFKKRKSSGAGEQ